ncbi:MAG: hypothetical protein COU51_05055 [Parcubacteria group bacterium CG10_big_fil_rev_8_21_14_0_10_36_14]|nr:MAG: hypothetical protein COU51_05055 [Parcubacteria group bacterium CG10_big_fil_rev_8_21_14_0_10_36_14]
MKISPQKTLLLLQTMFIGLFLFLCYFFGDAIFKYSIEYTELFLVFIVSAVIFITLTSLYFLGLSIFKKSFKNLNKVLRFFSYFLIIVIGSIVFLKGGFWIYEYGILTNIYSMLWQLRETMSTSPVYPALLATLVAIITINKRIDYAVK